MRINHIRVDDVLIFNLLLYLLILDLLFLTVLFLHLHLLILHHPFILRDLIILLILVDRYNFVKPTLILHIEISQSLQKVADIDKVILLDPLSN